MSTMLFRFSTYSIAELQECGAAFAVDFAERRFESERTEERTRAVLEWFRGAIDPGLRCCDGSSHGEFLVDQSHVTPSLPWRGKGDWGGILSTGPCEMRLALECEWGKYHNRKENHAAVLDDACKVAMLRAAVKIIVFATRHDMKQGKEDRAPIVQSLELLRTNSRDNAPWLWIDLPWIKASGFPRDVAFAVLA